MKSQYVLPITIVVVGALIAGAVFLAGKGSTTPNPTPGQNGTVTARAYDPAKDHLLGNPAAKVKVVEYLDLECPHCKVFSDTFNRLAAYYGPTGNVAFIARPFPLQQIHPNAAKEAQAAECAAQQGGDAAYYKFIDKLFAATADDGSLDLAKLPTIATSAGLDGSALVACTNSGKYAQRVQDSYNEAIAEGGQGTPYILIMVSTDAVPLSGDQPYDSMRAAIDTVLFSVGVSATATASTTGQ